MHAREKKEVMTVRSGIGVQFRLYVSPFKKRFGPPEEDF
jgi:hypothetical protein